MESTTEVHETPLTISTITATGDINMILDMHAFFKNIPLRAQDAPGATWGFLTAQFVDKATGDILWNCAVDSMGNDVPIQRSTRRKKRTAKHFENQVTLIYWERERVESGVKRGANIKCFCNGRIQMTGVRSMEEGPRILQRIFGAIEEMPRDVVYAKNPIPSSGGCRICLINSNFHIGFRICRESMFNLLVQLNLVCSFEPCIYQGVKLSFMWSPNKTQQDGRCTCSERCSGKCSRSTRNPVDSNLCVRVTCAIFQSGHIIITGARSTVQLNDAYEFLRDLAAKHRAQIQKASCFS